MASTIAEAFAEVQGPEFDARVGYSITPRKPAPTEEPIKAAFDGFDPRNYRQIALQLAARYRCHETYAEDAVQDGLLDLYGKRHDLFYERPEGWLGLLYEAARFRLLDIKADQQRTASIEGLVELAGDGALEDARPCAPLSIVADEDSRHVPPPRSGEEWSRTQVIGAIQRYGDYRGRPPRVKECRAINLLPSWTTIRRHFRTFNEAIIAAGMVPPNPVPRRPRSPVEVAETCAYFRRRHGYWPSATDARRRPGTLPSANAMLRCFGGTRSTEVQAGAEAILNGLGIRLR